MSKRILGLFFLLTTTNLIQAENTDATKPAKDSDLAHVAILEFINNTNDQNVAWLSTSLPESVGKSMADRFEFLATPKKKLEKKVKETLGTNKNYSLENIIVIGKDTNSDIVIYGNYVLNDKTQKLEITANIYHIGEKKVIGVVNAQSTIDSTALFQSIEDISKNIVDQISRFTLNVTPRPKDEKMVRVIVLVPTWKNEQEQKQAEKEIAQMKAYFSQKYDSHFITLQELFKEKKIVKAEKDKILNLAKERDKPKIIAWLEGVGIKDAFIVLVEKNKVQITPVADGEAAPETQYAANAKPEDKFQTFDKLSEETHIPRIMPTKVALSKKGQETRPLFGAIWRTLLIPGWGHFYLSDNRGYVYSSIWGVSILNATYAMINYEVKKKNYANASSDFDSSYDAYNSAGQNRTVALTLLGTSYLAALTDIVTTRPQNQISLTGALWRNLLIPGWGQSAAGDSIGSVYSGLWIYSASLFAYSTLHTDGLNKDYQSAFIDVDSHYENYNNSRKLSGALLFFWGSTYAMALSDLFLNLQTKNAAPTFSGGLWRDLVIPGWGHRYAGISRGQAYSSLWVGTLGLTTWSVTTASIANRNSIDASSDALATSHADNDLQRERNLMILAFADVYLITVTDYLIATLDRSRIGKYEALWRNLLIPGWGQTVEGGNRGSLYTGLWVTSVTGFTYSAVKASADKSTYTAATDDVAYKNGEYNKSATTLTIFGVALATTYAASLIDWTITHLIFAKKQQALALDLQGWRFSAFYLPGMPTVGNGNSLQVLMTKNF